jgi:hypothetical protein
MKYNTEVLDYGLGVMIDTVRVPIALDEYPAYKSFY